MRKSPTLRNPLRASIAAILLTLGAQGALAGVCELLDFGSATGYGAVLIGSGKSSIKGGYYAGDFSFAVASGARMFDQGPAYSGGPVNEFENGRIDYHGSPTLEWKMQTDSSDQWIFQGEKCTSTAVADPVCTGINQIDTTDINTDAVNIILAANAMATTQTYGAISTSVTFTGTGDENVIRITGAFELGSGETITIKGEPRTSSSSTSSRISRWTAPR